MILFMEVIDYDRFTRDDPIGEVEIPLMNFDLLGGQTVWKNLRPSQKRTVRNWMPWKGVAFDYN